MQLLEYFVWSKTVDNKLISKIAYTVILLQPIFSIILIKDENKKYILPLLVAYCIFLIFVFILKPINKIDFRMIPAENGHLSWKWLDFPLYIILIWVGFLVIRLLLNKEYFLLSFVLVSVAVTYYFYHKSLTWGSLWCWLANLVAFYLILSVIWKDFGPKIDKMKIF
jgi:hypothetical protein